MKAPTRKKDEDIFVSTKLDRPENAYVLSVEVHVIKRIRIAVVAKSEVDAQRKAGKFTREHLKEYPGEAFGLFADPPPVREVRCLGCSPVGYSMPRGFHPYYGLQGSECELGYLIEERRAYDTIVARFGDDFPQHDCDCDPPEERWPMCRWNRRSAWVECFACEKQITPKIPLLRTKGVSNGR